MTLKRQEMRLSPIHIIISLLLYFFGSPCGVHAAFLASTRVLGGRELSTCRTKALFYSVEECVSALEEPIEKNPNGIYTFQSQQGTIHPADEDFLKDLPTGICWTGPADPPVYPFTCHAAPPSATPRNDSSPAPSPSPASPSSPEKEEPLLVARDILSAIKVKHFESDHIPSESLDRMTELAWTGYQPYTNNDEIHTEDSEQYIFAMPEEFKEHEKDWNKAVQEYSLADAKNWFVDLDLVRNSANGYVALKSYVKDGKLWYVNLHSGDRQYLGWRGDDLGRDGPLLLFALGQSPHSQNLVGVITTQVCHNLCD